MAKHIQVKKVAGPKTPTRKEPEQKKERKPLLLSTTVVLFVLVWLWAGVWYGDVLHTAREYSFWAPDATLMRYMEGRPWAGLWWAGLALLQLFRWPLVGGAVMALLVSGSTWLTGYCLRLRGWWRLLQFVPALVYLSIAAYVGFDLYFETETGRIMGIPLMYFGVMLLLALIIRSFAHGHTFPHILLPPTDETPRQNRTQLAMACIVVLLPMAITHWMRPYVRVVARMQCQMMEQDWRGMAETARHTERFRLCITPEGTRSRVDEWKKGFYFIALKANLPILLYGLDYERKLIQCTKTIIPSGNLEEDMREIKLYFKDFKAKKPENFSIGNV